jgi:regulator-associated protein of mTOR
MSTAENQNSSELGEGSETATGSSSAATSSSTFSYYCEKRHERTCTIIPSQEDVSSWRMKEKLKTVSVALVLCLNIGGIIF